LNNSGAGRAAAGKTGRVEIELRAVREDEWPALARVDGAAFGAPPGEEELAGDLRGWELDRSLAAFERDQIVGMAAAYSFDLTLPGLTTTPAGGVTWVGVLPTHRRQGVLTRMMRHQLEDFHHRGEPLAVLTASESTIYGRFGYGPATTRVDYRLDRRHAALSRPGQTEGRLVLADLPTAAKVLPEVHDRCRRRQPGDISRPSRWWSSHFRRAENPRREAGRSIFVLCEGEGGEIDGYASYRVRRSDSAVLHMADAILVEDLTAATPGAYTALWQYLTSLDLSVLVQADNRPVDEPLRWMLADPRRLEGVISDHLWVRLVDLPAALAARRYGIEGDLVLEVQDRLCPWNHGRWQLLGAPGEAECRPTRAAPDLAMGVDDLGAVYLGGVRLSTLARAGRIEERVPGTLARADLLFACEPQPWCGTGF